MNFRTDLEIVGLDPEPGGMTMIHGRAPDGTTIMLALRVVEPLAVGGHMTLTLYAEPSVSQGLTAAQMRERMQVRGGAAAGQSHRPPLAAATAAATGTASAPASGVGSPPQAARASNTPSLLLSTILGGSPRSSVTAERDVDDEMDALLGARRKG